MTWKSILISTQKSTTIVWESFIFPFYLNFRFNKYSQKDNGAQSAPLFGNYQENFKYILQESFRHNGEHFLQETTTVEHGISLPRSHVTSRAICQPWWSTRIHSWCAPRSSQRPISERGKHRWGEIFSFSLCPLDARFHNSL